MSGSVRVLAQDRYVLAEGPCWNAARRELSWVDIEEGLILVAEYENGRLGPVGRISVGEQVGCAIPISGGRFLCGLESQIAIVGRDGTVARSRRLIPEGRRLNDGKVDPQGRFLVGSLSQHGIDPTQELIRLELDGSVTVLDSELSQSNGMTWSPDGRWFYHADTAAHRVHRRAYDADAVGPREAFIELDGMPDGITADEDGNVWVAVFDRQRVDCYSPDGELLPGLRVETPGRHPASVEFFGHERDELVIPTGFPRMPGDERLRTEADGVVLTVRADRRGGRIHAWAEVPLPR